MGRAQKVQTTLSALSEGDVENVRQYIIKRANEDKVIGE